MKSHAAKRSIVVAGHQTSVSLEEAFWNGTLSELVGEIDHNRRQGICLRLSGCSFSTTSRAALSTGALASSPQIL
jgi:predicted DNA-binding ribbon-helix-helix protein